MPRRAEQPGRAELPQDRAAYNGRLILRYFTEDAPEPVRPSTLVQVQLETAQLDSPNLGHEVLQRLRARAINATCPANSRRSTGLSPKTRN